MADIITEDTAGVLAAAVEENIAAFFAQYNPKMWGGDFYTEPNLLQGVTDIKAAMFNSVMQAQLALDSVDAAIETVIARASKRQVPVLWWVGPISRPAELGARLEVQGFALDEELPGMVLDLHTLNDSEPLPDGLTITQVTDEAGAVTWAKILAYGSGIPDEWFEPLRDWFALPALSGDGDYTIYLGHLDNEPVATASLYCGAGVAGIYNVSTLESARRRGIGRAMTLAPLYHAGDSGYRYSILHSSEAGHSVYQKIGYRDYCTMHQYVWSPEPA